MKKIILIVGLFFSVMAVSAQSIIGEWGRTNEQTETGEIRSYLTLAENGNAEIKIIYRALIDTDTGWIVATMIVPGLYMVEAEKALTIKCDRSKVSVKVEYEPTEALKERIKNKETVALEKFTKMESYVAANRAKIVASSSTLLVGSYLYQILSCNGGSLVLQAPAAQNKEEYFRVCETSNKL